MAKPLRQTKAEVIRGMLKAGMSPIEIEDVTGYSADYVRAVKARMIGGGSSAADKRYLEKIPDRIRRRRLHLRRLAYNRELYHARRAGLPEEAAKDRARRAYAAAPLVEVQEDA